MSCLSRQQRIDEKRKTNVAKKPQLFLRTNGDDCVIALRPRDAKVVAKQCDMNMDKDVLIPESEACTLGVSSQYYVYSMKPGPLAKQLERV